MPIKIYTKDAELAEEIRFQCMNENVVYSNG